MSREAEVEQAFTVRAELGLHARPAGQFVALAGRFSSEITVGRGEEWVSGCSILSILSLAAEHGSTLKIRAVGTDAEQAVSELGLLLEAAGQN
ncbi:MAG TPA: HPr family phosphocarrier protein [Myxococcales bacterium]|nr:HPr family phosphocarrier protein [Myxococcales bacterium]HIL01339.1 HPr family phosphocarrier protein [Myxococcales bacterium]